MKCICVLLVFSSCASHEVYKDGSYEVYKTFDLFFTFTYPTSWVIFEHESEVTFSNSTVLLTSLPNERSFTPHSFLGTLNLSDSQSAKSLYSVLMHHALFLSLADDGALGSKKKNLDISTLQKLSYVIRNSSYTTAQSSYERIMHGSLSKHAYGYTIGDTVLVIDGLLKQPDGVSKRSQRSVTQPEKEVVIRALGLRKITDEIFAMITGSYHTGVLVPEDQDDLLRAVAVVQPEEFLQDIVHALQSVGINAPPSKE